jgi:hypothetical protein
MTEALYAPILTGFQVGREPDTVFFVKGTIQFYQEKSRHVKIQFGPGRFSVPLSGPPWTLDRERRVEKGFVKTRGRPTARYSLILSEPK